MIDGRRLLLTLTVALSAVPAVGTPTALAAKAPSCYRGGAHLESASGQTRIVRVSAKRTSRFQTRHERLLACWAPTGRRVSVADEIDLGDDNTAITTVDIVQGRYVGVIAENAGGVSDSVSARVYDARKAIKLHDSADTCDKVDQGDLRGVDDVAFLRDGGIAMSCNRLLLYRSAADVLELIEPAGTNVSQLAVSTHSPSIGQRLFWTVGVQPATTTRSLVI